MRFIFLLLLSASALSSAAQDLPAVDPVAQEQADAALLTPPEPSDLVPVEPVEPVDFPLGMDARWRTITAKLHPEAFDLGREKLSVLVVSVAPPEFFEDERFLISWAPAPAPGASFPPGLKKVYIAGQQYLWRWILMLGPDAVVTDHGSLAAALSRQVPCADSLDALPDELAPSLLRSELEQRAARTPIGIAEAVAEHYGAGAESINYIEALAMIGRVRLADLKGEDLPAELQASAEEAAVVEKPNGPALAGNLVYAELGLEERVLAAAKVAAENPADNEMSDSVFMICPLLASAGALADDQKLLDACLRHLERMQGLCLRDDGLYRHSPLDDAAWGRGNGFPAMGLAWTLSELPESYAGRPQILEAFRAHLAALVEHQDRSGMWHQVIDQAQSYREFTSTCMITFAILRGMREGWLDKATYGPVAELAWDAIKLRISLDGSSFTDACTGTGKQRSLKDYFRRGAILGPDARSGAMALMVATERALWEREAGTQVRIPVEEGPGSADLELDLEGADE